MSETKIVDKRQVDVVKKIVSVSLNADNTINLTISKEQFLEKVHASIENAVLACNTIKFGDSPFICSNRAITVCDAKYFWQSCGAIYYGGVQCIHNIGFECRHGIFDMRDIQVMLEKGIISKADLGEQHLKLVERLSAIQG